MHAMLFLTCLLQYLSVTKSFWWFFPVWKPLTKLTRSIIDYEWDLAKQSSWRCPAESDDRSKRASRPPTRLINPSNLISLSLSGIYVWVCLLCFLHRLQQLSVRTESHRIEILTEGSREEERILGNDNQLFSQLLKVEHPDVDGVDVHLASGHLGQAEETVEQGGLATPCPTNNTHLGMLYNLKAFPKKRDKNLPFPQLLSGDWQNWVPKAGDLGTFWWNYLSRMITMSSGQNLSLTFFRVTMPSLGQWYGEVMVPSTWEQALCLCWVGY